LRLDTLSPDAVSSNELFHTPFVEYLVREHLERRANFGYHLWVLMTLLIWMKGWNIEAPKETGITQPLLHAVSEVGSLSQRLA
jgi:asparagine synthase (glutamine-hydrolysing)